MQALINIYIGHYCFSGKCQFIVTCHKIVSHGDDGMKSADKS